MKFAIFQILKRTWIVVIWHKRWNPFWVGSRVTVHICSNELSLAWICSKNINTWIINWTSLISKPRAATLVATKTKNLPALNPASITYINSNHGRLQRRFLTQNHIRINQKYVFENKNQSVTLLSLTLERIEYLTLCLHYVTMQRPRSRYQPRELRSWFFSFGKNNCTPSTASNGKRSFMDTLKREILKKKKLQNKSDRL